MGKIKSFFRKVSSKSRTMVAGLVCGLVTVAMSICAFAAEQTVITYSDMEPVIKAVTTQFSVSTVVAVLAAAAVIAIGFVFAWWGIRKVVRMIMGAAKGKKMSV